MKTIVLISALFALPVTVVGQQDSTAVSQGGMHAVTMTTTERDAAPTPSPDQKAWFGKAVGNILNGSAPSEPRPVPSQKP